MVFTSFEQQVLEKILEGPSPVLEILRTQLQSATINARRMTGAGFFIDFSIPLDTPVIPSKAAFQINDVVGEVNGVENAVGFVLYVEDGRLTTLEGFTYGEEWPASITEWTLNYRNKPRTLNFD